MVSNHVAKIISPEKKKLDPKSVIQCMYLMLCTIKKNRCGSGNVSFCGAGKKKWETQGKGEEGKENSWVLTGGARVGKTVRIS